MKQSSALLIARINILFACLMLAACATSSASKNQDVLADRSTTTGLTDNQIALAGFTESTMASRDLLGYRPLKRVLVTLADDAQLERLRDIAPEVEFVGSAGLVPDASTNGEFDAVILVCSFPGALDYAENVAWIHSYSAGVENCLAHPSLRS